MKRIGKRMLASICVLALVLSSISIGFFTHIVNAASARSGTLEPNADFTSITFSHFEIDDDEYAYNPADDFAVTNDATVDLDETVFRGKIKFAEGAGYVLTYGGTTDAWSGLYMDITAEGAWYLYWASPWTYLASGDAGSFPVGDWVTVMISTEIVAADSDNSENDIEFGLWINGTFQTEEYITVKDKADNLGRYFGAYCYSEGTKVCTRSVIHVEEEITPVYLKGFRNITTSSFVDSMGDQMENKRYDTSTMFHMKDMQGRTDGSFNRTLISMKLKYEVGSEASRIEIAGKDTSSALMLHTDEMGTQLVFTPTNWDNPIAHPDTFPIRLYAENTNLFSFLDEEFMLQMSIEYGDFDDDTLEDDMRIGFYINGTLYDNQHCIIPDCNFDEMFGDCLTVCCDGGAITVDSIVPVSTEMTSIAWSDYVEAGTNQVATDRLILVSDQPSIFQLGNQEIMNMENTAFEAKLTFEQSLYGNELRFAGANPEYGMFFLVGNDENLWLSPSSGISPELGLTDVLVFDKNVAGVETFLNKEFTFKITTEFDDYNGDGNANDVQLGLYINGILYNNQYLYGYNCRADFGPYLSVYSQSGSVVIRSVTDDYELKVWNLYAKGSAYEIEATVEDTVYIDGEVSKETSLSVPGDYLLQVGEDTPTQKIVVYSERDAHPDDILDIRDLVATVKGSQGSYLDTWAGNLGVQEAGADTATVRERLLSSMDTQESNAVDFEFIGEDVMPIAGFYGPHRSYDDEGRGNTSVAFEDFLKDDRWMKIISEAGINLIANTDANYASKDWPDEVNKLLEWGGKYGVGLFVSDSEVTKPAYLSKDAVIPVNTLRERIQEYSIYDAFCGLFVVDEPNTEYYPTKADGSYYNPEVDVKKPFISQYGNLANVLQHNLDIPCYLNMYAYWETIYQEKANYEAYVEEFCQTLQPKILMWDKYPFEKNETNDVYFYSMDVVRKNAQKNKIPFWAAIQAGGYFNDADAKNEIVTDTHYPNQNQFNWNINTCLAYGVQGLDYFPLIQPVHFAYEPDGEFDFERSGLIGADGFNTNENGEQKLNQWYYYAQDINKHISAIDHVLMNSVCQGLLLNVKESGTQVKDPNSSWNTETKQVENFLSDFAGVDEDYIRAKGSDNFYSVKENQFLSWTYYTQNDPVNSPASWREVVDVTGNAMIGCFNYHGKTALYVVNYSTDDFITITLDNTYHVKKTQNSQTSCIQEQEITLDMKAGEGVLLVIE